MIKPFKIKKRKEVELHGRNLGENPKVVVEIGQMKQPIKFVGRFFKGKKKVKNKCNDHYWIYVGPYHKDKNILSDMLKNWDKPLWKCDKCKDTTSETVSNVNVDREIMEILKKNSSHK